MKKFLFFIIYISSIFSLPVAVIHGFYDSCSNSFYPNLIKVLKYKGLNYAVCLKSGEGSESLFLSFEEQCQKACDPIQNLIKILVYYP
jgi:hypothetical protein